MTDTDTLPPALRGAKPSSRHIFEVLRTADGWLSYDDRRARTGYAHGTVSEACRELDSRNVAERRRNPTEPRQYQVRLAPDVEI